MERATGFEPVHRAWKARALPTELCPLGGRGRAGILPCGHLAESTPGAGSSTTGFDAGNHFRIGWALQDRKAQIVPTVLVLLSCTEMLPWAQMDRRQDLEVPDQAQAPAHHHIEALLQGLNKAGTIVDLDIGPHLPSPSVTSCK
jgi:hypothetical protein